MAGRNGIDVHTHVVPDRLPEYRGERGDLPWPSVDHGECSHARVMISGKNFRSVTDKAWNVAARLEDMAAMGVSRQVLSPMPELLSYWLPAADAQRLLRHVNESIASMVAAAPGRFTGLGGVPLQDSELAIRELDHALNALGLAGLEIGPNVNGVPIGDPRFEPFFAEAEKRGAVIFVHPLRPAGMDRLVGPPVLEQIVAFPCEMAFGIASLMTGGLLERHPRLRIACSHGGGAFALVLARMHATWHKLEPLRQAMPSPPREYARRLYYDTCVFDPKVLRFLIDSFGEDRLFIGTDYPFGTHEQDPLGFLGRAGLSPAAFAALCSENAERFLDHGAARHGN